jgi:flagellar biosynthesis/type III secretory pathway M-ring protein FliF/YscJ
VASLKFASPAAAGGGAAGGPLAVLGGDPFSLVKKIGAALAVLVLLFLVRRNLKRREDDPIAPEPKWLREIQHTTPLAELSAPTPVNDLNSVRRKEMQATAEEIVRKNPDQVAMQVAQWMSE